MSEAFFRELDLPQPKYNLGVGSGSRAVQSGKMLVALDEVLSQEIPELFYSITLPCSEKQPLFIDHGYQKMALERPELSP